MGMAVSRNPSVTKRGRQSMGHNLSSTGLNKQDFSKRSWSFPQGSKKATRQLQMSHTCSRRERYIEGKMGKGGGASRTCSFPRKAKVFQKAPQTDSPLPHSKEITGQNQGKQSHLAVKEAVKIQNSIQRYKWFRQFAIPCLVLDTQQTQNQYSFTRRDKQLLGIQFIALTPLRFVFFFFFFSVGIMCCKKIKCAFLTLTAVKLRLRKIKHV